MTNSSSACLLILSFLSFIPVAFAGETDETTVLEAEDVVAEGAEVFRDERASGGKCVGVILAPKRRKPLAAAEVELPAGDYAAVFRLEVVPIEILHHLGVTLGAGDTSITLRQIQFDSRQGYQPFELRFFHAGGPLRVRISGRGGTGFDGMRKSLSEQEKAGMEKLSSTRNLLDEDADEAELDDDLAELEEGRNVKQLNIFDHRLLCDKIEIRPLRLPPAAVTRVEVDKVHYLPREKVRARAWVRSCADGGDYQFAAEEVAEFDSAREVFAKTVHLEPEDQVVEFEYELTDREFGHELRCSLLKQKKILHSNSEFFGVSRNVYRVGITARAGGQDMRNFTAERGAKIMKVNKRNYANYFERFAWAPCDYSNLAPETEIFYSGQTQYPGSISGFKNLIAEAHRVGVKAITYGKSCAAGIDGFKTFQRHPEFFGQRPEGLPTEQMNTFYLERMLADDYLLHAKPSEGGWQHWASLWTNWGNKATVEFGAEAIVKSVEMFGWDGIRWDGHFVGAQQPFIDILNEKCPNFIHGYNIAFANPGSKLFLPPANAVEDFHAVAKDHGLMMDESVRNWSHSNFSSGKIRPFYEAICREGDYIRRIGGLPLFITFDMASNQDLTFNVLCGLAAGERYTYLTSPGDFCYGPLPKFLTRYSAFVWDDTKRVAEPDAHIEITVGDGSKGSAPWWRESVWLREAADGRRQLLIHILNPPSYNNFCTRVQPPPKTLKNLSIRVKTPADARFIRAVHISPDLSEGHIALKTTRNGDRHCAAMPRLRTWSIVAFEYSGEPDFPLTTPVEDAAVVLKKRAEELKKKAAEQKAKAGIGPGKVTAPKVRYYKDYTKTFNVDLETEKKLEKPADLSILRNGIFDVHHARGPFSWLNPVESAVGIVGGSYRPSWVDRVGFKLRAAGCMDDFPDDYERLLSYDVLVLDNIHSFELGGKRRCMAADFVRNGGGLLIFGGFSNLSLGAGRNTYLAELIPVRIGKYHNTVRDDKGLRLKVEKKGFFGGVDWSRPVCTFILDVSELKDGVDVLASAGGRPAIVAHKYGKGRVVTVLMNQHGNYPETVMPYWQWSQWPKILAACIRWLGEGAETKVARKRPKRVIDTGKILPEDLMMEAFDLSNREFTAKLKEAQVNVIDAESARILLEAAVDNIEKVNDLQILTDVIELTSTYFDKSFAKLGEKLATANADFIRKAGYQILGLAGDRKYRPILEKGLREESAEAVREALAGLGRLADPASREVLRNYLRDGSEKLLAMSVLLRLGDKDILREALTAYEKALVRRIRLKSGRRSIIEKLWGGVSFKLTKAARKRAMAEYRKVLKLEKEVNYDLRYFVDSLRRPDDAELEVIVDFLAKTGTREILSMAYALFSRMPEDKAAAYRSKMARAKLAELRLLAED